MVIEQIAEILSSDKSITLAYDPAIEHFQAGTFAAERELCLHAEVLEYVRSQLPKGLYTHQQLAINQVLQGHNTVVATRTSSGKSLIYSLPILDSLCRDPNSTALFLFPLKALANDQLLKLQSMANFIPSLRELQKRNPQLISRYDGCIEPDQRKYVRDNCQVVLTNPDMLHLGIMQHHTSNWARFFRNLRIVAIDECHEYRGIFGTNVAYILHRLRQICEMHGSAPRIVATSATICEPKEHMERLTGATFNCIDNCSDGSQHGARKFWMVTGDSHYLEFGRRLAKNLADAGLTVLVFCPSRISAERMIARTVKADDSNSYVRVYRSGLTGKEREGIEQGLRSKTVRLVFSTSALELGIDIGQIDVVVCVGLPHSMMSLWQRAGRVARGAKEGATILIPADTPIDTYYSAHPEQLFAREHEPLVLNLQNRRVACQHYACAVQEVGGDESLLRKHVLGDEANRIGELRSAGKLSHEIFYCTDPHIEVNIRNGGHRPFTLQVDDDVIGEIDYFHLLRECYTNAIYRHGGRSYRVLNVLYGKRLVRLRPEFSRNDTSPHLQKRIRVKRLFRVAEYSALRVATASLDVTEFLTSVTEKDIAGKTVMTWAGSSGMRQYQLPTEGTMLAFAKPFWSEVSTRIGVEPSVALGASERLITSLFPTVSGPCDSRDFSSGVDRLATGENALFLFDTVYDGVDLTSAVFEKMPDLINKSIERVTACECETDRGCFSCIANPLADETTSKSITQEFLRSIAHVLSTETPVVSQIDDHWEEDVSATANCNVCKHKLALGARFCSECGSQVAV